VAGDGAVIRIEREPGHYADRARAYHVFLDGRDVGQLRHGQSLELDVAPGRHEVHLKIDWGSSPIRVVELAAGERASLVCKPNANPLTVLWYATFGRKSYVDLRRA
jgi:hypothetical protein